MKNINWAYVIGGIILIIGSIFAFTNPFATFVTLAIMLGIAAIARGIMLILDYNKLKNISHAKANFSLILAVFLIILGIIFFVYPSLSVIVLTIAIALWFIFDAIYGLANSGVFGN